MKIKKIVILGATIASLIAVPVLASSLDFSFIKDYSNDDLLALKTEVNNEIKDRGLNKSAELIPGLYYVGSDIPAGRYTIELVELSGESTEVLYFAYEDASAMDDDFIHIDSDLYGELNLNNPKESFTLIDGGSLAIEEGGIVKLQKSEVEWN